MPIRIPLCVGLQIVTAISQPNGDYESIKTVESMNDGAVRIKYSAEQLVTDFLAPNFGSVQRTLLHRSLRREDLKSATLYEQRYLDGMPESIPETTAIGTSAAVLTALKTTGHADLSISNAYSGEYAADRSKTPSLYDFMTNGELRRVGAKATMLSVVVNGVSTQLPTVQAQGDYGGERSEFFFLDDETNPLALKFRVGIDAVEPPNKEMLELCRSISGAAANIAQALCGRKTGGDRESLQVVKISYRCSEPLPASLPASAGSAGLERELAAGGKVAIYDIYFSFNSDRIRDESLPRLAEIADVLRKHSDWVLAVGGHTDSVGGNPYNQNLSERRAAAVKAELIKRYSIAASRLQSSGFGASQPRDTNDTLEGRAKNRRVELVKQ
jgi:outer membrane protein OmpA-like peptidoglycan-associated protein